MKKRTKKTTLATQPGTTLEPKAATAPAHVIDHTLASAALLRMMRTYEPENDGPVAVPFD